MRTHIAEALCSALWVYTAGRDRGLETSLLLPPADTPQTHTGLPLVDGSDPQQPSRRVHTYAQEWAFQADGYEPVYYSHSRLM